MKHSKEKNNVLVYPNPFQKLLTIEMPNDLLNNLEVVVFSIDGKLVYNEKMNPFADKTAINTSGWGKGIYLIVIKDSGRIVSFEKAVKE